MDVGLRFPDDIFEWQRWQNRAGLVQKLRGVKPGRSGPGPIAWHGPAEARIVVGLDSRSPTSDLALARLTEHLRPGSFALIAPAGMSVPGGVQELGPFTSGVGLKNAVLAVSLGHHLPVGSALADAALGSGARQVVVQHGLLTAFSPPASRTAHLMAWSDADADFWLSGRTDVTAEVIGSQLLWEAACTPAPASAPTHDDLPLTYLGQLHGAELPRRDMARSTGAFCRATGATYRPHPSEKDKLSRAQHAIWRRQGMTIDDGAVPLASLNAPVVSAFSTGVLEAAAKGIPAWVHYDNPPAWLTEFWQRYRMAQFGGEPTPAPTLPEREPAALLAERITAMLEE